MKRFIGFGIIIFFMLLLLPQGAKGLTAHSRLSTTTGNPVQLSPASNNSVTVDLTGAPSGSYTDVNLSNLITFGVDHHHSMKEYFPTTLYPNGLDVKVVLSVTTWDINNSNPTTSPCTLEVKFHPFDTNPYVDKQAYAFTGAYKFTATITDIWINNVAANVLPSHLYIDADISVDRYLSFATNSSNAITMNASSAIDLDCDGTDDELTISWQTMAGAVEYQLEWTYVNDYGTTTGTYITSPATLSYDFRNNSTRITTTLTSHNITLAFDHGYILYRVRGVGRDLTDITKPITGVWNVADQGSVWSVTSQYHNSTPHEGNKNWQYSATYAEEGKKKEVVNYFDGSLRNRQSVTKVNSDDNTIVGETKYDHQGRPAVNVLPVPVADPTCTTGVNEASIKYYPKFNKDLSLGEYGREDFDYDTGCTPSAGEMSTNSGASNYYSSSNPDKSDQQAFVPDAKKYPFTQIEYTPDNTGRIRRQSGVGSDYKLGSNHETKYYYGKPNQIQLDRMFGSEVGDESHYKKNLVIDANGQVSVTYLDQEGKTIATALAGDAPSNLQALPSESTAGVNLTVDLFAENANGVSNQNTVDQTINAIIFNTELLVVNDNTEHSLDYSISIDQLSDPCLAANVCFNCAYDLEIMVLDECGAVVASSPSGTNPVDKVIGKFQPNGSGSVVLTTSCATPSLFTHNESFQVTLNKGNYTIVKKLTLNKDARDYYVQQYLNSANNTCILTLQDFIDSAMATIDTTDCAIACSTCVASLGTRDDFVASGKGTELEYDLLYEQCNAPCKKITLCEASYQQMLSDVSPGGQYAEYKDPVTNNINLSLYPLSVLNDNNYLPKSFNGPDFIDWLPEADWRKPKVKVNGTDYSMYLEEDGSQSIVELIQVTATTYNPAVVSSGLVYYNSTEGFYYTYPENLLNLADFIANWKPSWAASLVQYHPEYGYFETCSEYSRVQSTTDTYTSEEFDDLLRTTDTYAAAVANNLIISNSVTHWFTQSSTDPYDPFVTSGVFGTYGSTLQSRYNSYQNGNSMLQSAAITTRCGTTYYGTPAATCDDFGTGANTATLDQEWVLLKNLYLSEKQKLQQDRADAQNKLSSSKCFNGCIGNDNFNPAAEGFVTAPHSSAPFFDRRYTCSVYMWHFLKDKQKRFLNDNDFSSHSYNNSAYQAFAQTGQCPLAFELQHLLGKLASENKLTNTTGEPLVNHPEFTIGLYDYVNGFSTSPFVPYNWQAVSPITDLLRADLINTNNSTVACSMTLDKTGSGITNWSDVIGFKNLQYTTTSSGMYNFSVIAVVTNTTNPSSPFHINITGSTCINISSCSFDQVCNANDFSLAIQNLMSGLAITGTSPDLLSTTAIDLSTNYPNFITPVIKNTLGSPNTQLRWKYLGSGGFELYDATNASQKITIQFNTYDPSTFTHASLNTLKGFSQIKSEGQNLFVMKGLDNNLAEVVTIHGQATWTDGTNSVNVSMGACDYPEPVACQGTEFDVRKDLEALLNSVLLETPSNSNIDLYTSPYFTNLLRSYADQTLTQTSGSITSVSGTPSYEKLTISMSGCDPTLWHRSDLSPARTFADLVDFYDIKGTGTPAADGNYYSFTAKAVFLVSGTYYYETIWGTSCWPIKNCDPCQETPFFPAGAICTDIYNDYVQLANSFNDFVTANPGLGYDTIYPILTSTAFYLGNCQKFDQYEEYIFGLFTDSSFYEGITSLDIRNFQLDSCSVSDTVSLPEYDKYDNPCADYIKAIAVENAENDYNEYIKGIITSISSAYTSHCLSADEEFTDSYTDKEYHFTLYYYDQAGNLVRTVPPEGVQLLNITSPTSADEIKANSDRTNGTRTVFTNHLMVTTYEYNSLNQLVKQSVPDHDMMDIWELTLPNGLPSTLKVTATQFVNSTRGYLAGYIDPPSPNPNNIPTRGYLYTTNDGGVTWTKVDDVVASDLKKIQMIDATTGYAVGSQGILLMTVDGGSNWDMVDLYGQGITAQLNDLHFVSTSNGVIVGTGIVLYYNGTSFSVEGAFSSSDDIISVTSDGTSYYAVLNINGEGRIFKRTGVNTWSQQTSIASSYLTKVEYVSSSIVFAAGPDGTLMKSTDGGVNWKLISTNTAANFIDFHFKSATDGIAIIESTPGFGQIWKTFNGGDDWELMSNATDDYNALYFYQSDKGVAVGNSGLVKRIVMSQQPFAFISITAPPTTAHLHSAWAVSFSASNLHILAGGDDGKLYPCNIDLGQQPPTITWGTATSALSGEVIGRISAQKLSSAAEPPVSGVVVTQSGGMYGFKKDASSQSYTLSSTQIASTVVFADVTDDNGAHTPPKLLALSNPSSGNREVYYVDLAANTVPSSATAYAQNMGSTSNMYGLAYDNNTMVAVGEKIYAATLDATGTSITTGFTDNTNKVTPLPFNDVQYAGAANTLYTIGNEGSVYQTTNGTDWKLLSTGTATQLNSIKFKTATSGLIAGNSGALYRHSISGSSITLTTITTPNTENLYDVAISSISNVAYAVGAKGTVVYMSNMNNTSGTLSLPNPTDRDFRGVGFKASSNTIIAVSDRSGVYQYVKGSGTKIRMVHTPKMKDVHFTNSMNGYAVADNYTIRHTQNGGLRWAIALPASISGPLPVLNEVWTREADEAVIAGNANYLAKVSTLTVTTVTSPLTGSDLHDVAFGNSQTGYIVGTQGKIAKTTDGGTSWTALTSVSSLVQLNALHVFSDLNALAVGTGGTAAYINGSINTVTTTGYSPTSYSTAAFNDVFFHDDVTGYIVADNGIVLKTSSTMVSTGVSWSAMTMTDAYGVTTTSDIDIKTVDFASRYNGFFGGNWNTVTATPNYARLIRDESKLFSTYFWYDRLGRMVLSQNTKQFDKSPKAYSYTLYDALGRKIEVGEKAENATGAQFNSIFGAYVSSYYNPKVIDDTKLNTWITSGGNSTRTEVTKTYYDKVETSIASNLSTTGFSQNHLRKRVACMTYEDVYDNDHSTYQHATHYSYDIHGNVASLLQDNTSSIVVSGQRFKQINYSYDLINGNVNSVAYQEGAPDQFYHKYEYDADNRVTHVYTSKDNILWDMDAKYFYYDHGPLARVEVGDNKVQGIDYAYTLSGWIKGVNSNTLDETRDIGKDGTTGNNSLFGKDAFGYTLGYYSGDYEPIDATNKWTTVTSRFEASLSSSDLLAARNDLYNGNIGHTVTTITQPKSYTSAANDNPTILPLGTAYKYDQMNRLLDSKAYQNINSSTNTWQSGSSYAGLYQNRFSYDANGNILSQSRNDETGATIDDLSYKYYNDGGSAPRKYQNRLYHVDDNVSSTAYMDDIDDPATASFDNTEPNNLISSTNNYLYDPIGNLIKDKQAEIDQIKWSVHGKIKEVVRTSGSTKKNLKFDYDASGNRIAKHVYTSANVWETSEFYVRDAQGNVMSIYKKEVISSLTTYKQKERTVYGSSRLGNDAEEKEMIGASNPSIPATLTRTLGNKQYEGTNHLGNVLAVFTDKKIPRDDNSDAIWEYFQPELLSSTDYSAFGVELRGRAFQSLKYRFGFNGMEKDDEVKGSGNSYDFGARIYDSRLGNWYSLDPSANVYPGMSPYCFSGNNPIAFYDPDGKKIVIHYVDADGTPKQFVYKPKAKVPDNAFVKSVVNDINALRAESSRSRKLIDRTVKNKNVASIHQGTENYTSVSGVIAEYDKVADNNKLFQNASNSQGTNADISYNPNMQYGALDEAGSMKRPSRIGLLEELFHSNRILEGKASIQEKTFNDGEVEFKFFDINAEEEEKVANDFVNYHRAAIDPTGNTYGIVENYHNSDGVSVEVVGSNFSEKKKYYNTKDVAKNAKKMGVKVRDESTKIDSKFPNGTKLE